MIFSTGVSTVTGITTGTVRTDFNVILSSEVEKACLDHVLRSLKVKEKGT